MSVWTGDILDITLLWSSEEWLSDCIDDDVAVSELVDIGDDGEGGSEKAGEYTCPWYK